VTVNAQYALVTMAYDRKLIALALVETLTLSVFYKLHQQQEQRIILYGGSRDSLDGCAAQCPDWIAAGATALITVLVAIIIRRLTKRRVRKKDKHAELTDFGGRMLISLVLATGAYYTLEALDVELAPALGAFGIGALFIAVGLQPLLVNLVGSVVLQARRPFRRGDQILSNGYEGTVLDISSASTVLLSYDGESIHIPNSQGLGQPLVNWTHEPVRSPWHRDRSAVLALQRPARIPSRIEPSCCGSE